MQLTYDILKELENSNDEMLSLIEALCNIPAPSGLEEKRAEFCKGWLEANGAEGVYIDDAKNVVYPVNCENKDSIILFSAHTDTVFPYTEPMPFVNDGEYLHSPGVGDDTACLASLLMVAKYVAQNKPKSNKGILFVANSCEEGLGNLKGIKQIMKDYGERITEAYAFDSCYDHMYNRCVGSERYKINFKTEGGHSFNAFGNSNAIVAAAELITELYKLEVPKSDGNKTTYNVGTIEGGCSVNTIAEDASFLYEYRSDDYESLKIMREQFKNAVEKFKNKNKAEITVETIGIRPCGNLKDTSRLDEMTKRVIAVTEKHTGEKCAVRSASTDCNIPMSLGIPAVCVGAFMGDGAHTRAEKVLIKSIPIGLKITAEIILGFFD